MYMRGEGSCLYLLQCLSVTAQRGNTVSVVWSRSGSHSVCKMCMCVCMYYPVFLLLSYY